MSEHTKGPWAVEGDDESVPGVPCIGIASAEKRICDVASTLNDDDDWQLTGEDRANARLIAAAPELLEALELADQFISNGIEFGYILMPEPETPDSAHDAPGIIRAAIAKAKGQQ